MKSKVYFTRALTPEAVVKMYNALGVELPGKVAVKIHTGEQGNQNYMPPEFWKPMIDEIGGTVCETNTAYGDASAGVRDHTDTHLKLIEEHGWNRYFTVDLMDAEGEDHVWLIPDGKVLKENHVPNHITNYDSMLVLAHFKGHPMGGYGGALKQLAIGCASAKGKALIHSAGVTNDRFECWDKHAGSVVFPEAMADAASSIYRHFEGKIAFVNVMKNLSVDCDCCAVAEDPCMADIGILSSTDPVAIDQACMDLGHEVRRPGQGALHGAREQPQRHPHHRGRRRARLRQPRVRAYRNLSKGAITNEQDPGSIFFPHRHHEARGAGHRQSAGGRPLRDTPQDALHLRRPELDG